MYRINLVAAWSCVGASQATKHDIHMLFGELAIGYF
jgi:hypothetical protein